MKTRIRQPVVDVFDLPRQVMDVDDWTTCIDLMLPQHLRCDACQRYLKKNLPMTDQMDPDTWIRYAAARRKVGRCEQPHYSRTLQNWRQRVQAFLDKHRKLVPKQTGQEKNAQQTNGISLQKEGAAENQQIETCAELKNEEDTEEEHCWSDPENKRAEEMDDSSLASSNDEMHDSSSLSGEQMEANLSSGADDSSFCCNEMKNTESETETDSDDSYNYDSPKRKCHKRPPKRVAPRHQPRRSKSRTKRKPSQNRNKVNQLRKRQNPPSKIASDGVAEEKSQTRSRRIVCVKQSSEGEGDFKKGGKGKTDDSTTCCIEEKQPPHLRQRTTVGRRMSSQADDQDHSFEKRRKVKMDDSTTCLDLVLPINLMCRSCYSFLEKKVPEPDKSNPDAWVIYRSVRTELGTTKFRCDQPYLVEKYHKKGVRNVLRIRCDQVNEFLEKFREITGDDDESIRPMQVVSSAFTAPTNRISLSPSENHQSAAQGADGVIACKKEVMKHTKVDKVVPAEEPSPIVIKSTDDECMSVFKQKRKVKLDQVTTCVDLMLPPTLVCRNCRQFLQSIIPSSDLCKPDRWRNYRFKRNKTKGLECEQLYFLKDCAPLGVSSEDSRLYEQAQEFIQRFRKVSLGNERTKASTGINEALVKEEPQTDRIAIQGPSSVPSGREGATVHQDVAIDTCVESEEDSVAATLVGLGNKPFFGASFCTSTTQYGAADEDSAARALTDLRQKIESTVPAKAPESDKEMLNFGGFRGVTSLTEDINQAALHYTPRRAACSLISFKASLAEERHFSQNAGASTSEAPSLLSAPCNDLCFKQQGCLCTGWSGDQYKCIIRTSVLEATRKSRNLVLPDVFPVAQAFLNRKGFDAIRIVKEISMDGSPCFVLRSSNCQRVSAAQGALCSSCSLLSCGMSAAASDYSSKRALDNAFEPDSERVPGQSCFIPFKSWDDEDVFENLCDYIGSDCQKPKDHMFVFPESFSSSDNGTRGRLISEIIKAATIGKVSLASSSRKQVVNFYCNEKHNSGGPSDDSSSGVPLLAEERCPFGFEVQWNDAVRRWVLKAGTGCRFHNNHGACIPCVANISTSQDEKQVPCESEVAENDALSSRRESDVAVACGDQCDDYVEAPQGGDDKVLKATTPHRALLPFFGDMSKVASGARMLVASLLPRSMQANKNVDDMGAAANTLGASFEGVRPLKRALPDGQHSATKLKRRKTLS